MCVLLLKRFTAICWKGAITVRTREGLRPSNSYTKWLERVGCDCYAKQSRRNKSFANPAASSGAHFCFSPLCFPHPKCYWSWILEGGGCGYAIFLYSDEFRWGWCKCIKFFWRQVIFSLGHVLILVLWKAESKSNPLTLRKKMEGLFNHRMLMLKKKKSKQIGEDNMWPTHA